MNEAMSPNGIATESYGSESPIERTTFAYPTSSEVKAMCASLSKLIVESEDLKQFIDAIEAAGAAGILLRQLTQEKVRAVEEAERLSIALETCKTEKKLADLEIKMLREQQTNFTNLMSIAFRNKLINKSIFGNDNNHYAGVYNQDTGRNEQHITGVSRSNNESKSITEQ